MVQQHARRARIRIWWCQWSRRADRPLSAVFARSLRAVEDLDSSAGPVIAAVVARIPSCSPSHYSCCQKNHLSTRATVSALLAWLCGLGLDVGSDHLLCLPNRPVQHLTRLARDRALPRSSAAHGRAMAKCAAVSCCTFDITLGLTEDTSTCPT